MMRLKLTLSLVAIMIGFASRANAMPVAPIFMDKPARTEIQPQEKFRLKKILRDTKEREIRNKQRQEIKPDPEINGLV